MAKKIELLAPAGSPEALRAAVENGADAVYLGGRLFSARQHADNFGIDDLREGLEYAHVRGVKVYLTMNILISDREMKEALSYAVKARQIGVDGFIVQDLGFAAALRRIMPDVPLHGSTQMTVYDLDGAKALEEMGFQRVVLARELDIKELTEIAHNTKLEVEAFVHGALCICYSGQCLLSSIIGGRSGNRGRCAQPCRLPYTLSDKAVDRENGMTDPPKYILSPKDICSIDFLDEIVLSGIHSLKIEGRMKSPEYVATVVRIYRKYLDLAESQTSDKKSAGFTVEDKDKHDLLQIFNRGGFTEGYLKGKRGADIMSFEKPNNSGIYIGNVLSYNKRTGAVKVRLAESLSVGDGVEIWTGDSNSPGGVVSSISLTDGKNIKSQKEIKYADKGDLVTIGEFNGKITNGSSIYKTTDAELNKYARESYNTKNNKKIEITGKAVINQTHPMLLTVKDNDKHTAVARGTVLPEAAIHRAISVERLREQITKTGGTPFEFSKLEIQLGEGLALPIGEINEVRRKALDTLFEMRTFRGADGFIDDNIYDKIEEEMQNTVKGQPKNRMHSVLSHASISLYFYRWNSDIDYASFGADRIYLPLEAWKEKGFTQAYEALRGSGAEVFAWLPPITRGNWSKLIESLLNIRENGKIDKVLVGDIGTAHKMKSIDMIESAGDISLNIFNTKAIREAGNLGLSSVALSSEMTMQQIEKLGKPYGGPAIEAVVYGRLPLMISEYCPVGSVKGGFNSLYECSGSCSKGDYILKDRMGMEFPVICDKVDCRSTILNSKILFVPDLLQELSKAGVSIFRLYIWDEEPEEIKKLVQLHRHRDMQQNSPMVERIRASGFTRGHYRRGV